MSDQLTKEQIVNNVKERIKAKFIPLYLADGTMAEAGYHADSGTIYKNVDNMVAFTIDGYKPKEISKEERKMLDDIRYAELDKKSIKQEAERFEKANKIKFGDWKGGQFYDGDTFHSDIESYLDSLIELHGYHYDEFPLYVWATIGKSYITKKDALDVYENNLEELGSEDFDWWTVDGVEDLQAALNEFVELNKSNVAYWADHTTALLIADEIEELKKQHEDSAT